MLSAVVRRSRSLGCRLCVGQEARARAALPSPAIRRRNGFSAPISFRFRLINDARLGMNLLPTLIALRRRFSTADSSSEFTTRASSRSNEHKRDEKRPTAEQRHAQFRTRLACGKTPWCCGFECRSSGHSLADVPSRLNFDLGSSLCWFAVEFSCRHARWLESVRRFGSETFIVFEHRRMTFQDGKDDRT